MMMAVKNLGVIYGSRSCEHEVSVISAVQMMREADSKKYNIIPIYISQKGEWFTGEKLKEIKTYTPFNEYDKGIQKVRLDLTAGSGALLHYTRATGLFNKGLTEEVVARIDCAVLVLHGLHGEDGSIQGLLELANIPYTSTGITPSAVGMDKITMKCFFRGMGFPVLPSVAKTRSEYKAAPDKVISEIETLGYPVFTKPACLGSSIGVSRADNREKLREALELAFSYDRRVLIEKGLDRPIELNCSVLGYDDDVKASVIEMPNTGSDFLDFSEKYLAGNGGSKGMASLKRIIPAPIGEELTKKLQELSIEIFRSMDCKGVVRIDYMLDRESCEYYITEINTIPGSLAFYLWAETGLDYKGLIDKMVESAVRAWEDKNENNFAFSSDILKGVNLGGTKGAKGAKLSGTKC